MKLSITLALAVISCALACTSGAHKTHRRTITTAPEPAKASPAGAHLETVGEISGDRQPAGTMQQRRFRLTVSETEPVTVRAGTFEVFRVDVEPLDGDRRGRIIAHMARDAPHIVVNLWYVVNPTTIPENSQFLSIAYNELVRVDTP